MATTKCDIIRDAGYAASCGMCTALFPPDGSAAKAVPQGCTKNSHLPPSVVCSVGSMANKRMSNFADLYSPASLFENADDQKTRTTEEKDYITGIQKTELDLAAAYPGVVPGATSISWLDVERCLWDTSGDKGPSGNMYFKRNDMVLMGLKPEYPIGGAFAQNSIWKTPDSKPSPVPTIVDYIMNPDLFVIVMFALLVIIFATLMWVAQQTAKKQPYLDDLKREKDLQQLEANDVYRGTAFPTYRDPDLKCRTVIDKGEMEGLDMSLYRKQCGLPPKG